MGTEVISGVHFERLPVIRTTGGRVMHAIRALDAGLRQFGECYFSTADFQSPKAWKKHTRMTCNLFVPVGEVKFVFYDDRPDSPDYGRVVEWLVSDDAAYGRLVIGPGIWFGFASVSRLAAQSILLNVADLLHDPQESLRLEPGDVAIPYTWTFDLPAA